MRRFKNRATKIKAQGKARRSVRTAKVRLTKAKTTLTKVTARRVDCATKAKK